jgi:hypothetical protein
MFRLTTFGPINIKGIDQLEYLCICRCEDNIIMDLGEMRCEDVDWTETGQDRVQNQNFLNILVNIRAA